MYCFKCDYMESLNTIERISTNCNPLRTGKRRHSESGTYSNIPLSNKYLVLQNEIHLENINSYMNHDNFSPQTPNTESNISVEKKK